MPSLAVSTMYVRNSLAAAWFLENFHTIHTFAAHVLTRLPLGPAGSIATTVFLKTSGLVSSVVRYAEIASWTQHAIPEARYRLSEASSQEKTSAVMPSSKSALANLSASRVSFESMRTFSPEGSSSAPPKPNSTERQFRLASAHCENWIPVGCPFGFKVRAATRASSQVSGALSPLASNRSLRYVISRRM